MSIVDKKYWPIESETSCYLKWSWSTIYLNRATTASCHRTVHLDITPENFDQFHNLPKKVDDRRRMLAGGWPEESVDPKWGLSGCTYCKYLEDAGGDSDRIVQIKDIPSIASMASNYLPPELKEDPTAIEVTPTILEIYFNNTCNMACLYCGPHFSSMWAEENRKFNGIDHEILVNPQWEKDKVRYLALRDKLFEWLRKNGHRLWNLGILGGEPLYQEEIDMLLDHYSQYPNPELLLTMTTNLKYPLERLRTFVERCKKLIDEGKIRALNLSCSLDCWGPEIEYVRWGLDLEQWRQNFDYLVDHEWIILNVNYTITPLTIKTLPELITRINEWDKRRHPTKHITFSFMHVVEPAHLNPKIFGPGVFDKDFERILAVMPQNTDYQKSRYPYMKGIGDSIEQSTPDPKLIGRLEEYLNEVDRRRNTSWRSVFPWLVPIIDDNRKKLTP